MTQLRMDQAAFEGIEPEYEVGGALQGQTTAALTTGLVSFGSPTGSSCRPVTFTPPSTTLTSAPCGGWLRVRSRGRDPALQRVGREVRRYCVRAGRRRFFRLFLRDRGGATVTIKRIPLAGGAATVLATLTNIDVFNNRRNLRHRRDRTSTGEDVSSVRKMPIGGGCHHRAGPQPTKHADRRRRSAGRKPDLCLGDDIPTRAHRRDSHPSRLSANQLVTRPPAG